MEYSLKRFPYVTGGIYDCKIPLKIGNTDKRICRFCGKSVNDGIKFGNEENAHAISDALGNKNVFCLEECICCNTKLGEKEQDLIKFLTYPICIYKTKGKIRPNRLDGLRNVDSSYLIITNENNLLKITIKPNKNKHKNGISQLNCNHLITKLNYSKFREQNVYKTLCKYVISLCQLEHKNLFQKTIQWINEPLRELDLPPILLSVTPIVEHPTLSYCIRRNQDETLPYVIAELRVVCFSFLYIVPFSGINVEVYDFKILFNSFERIVRLLPLSYEYSVVKLDSIELKTMEFTLQITDVL